MGKHISVSRLLWAVYLKRLIGPTLKNGFIDEFIFYFLAGVLVETIFSCVETECFELEKGLIMVLLFSFKE